MFSGIKSFVSNAYNTVKSAVSNVASAIGNAFTSAPKGSQIAGVGGMNFPVGQNMTPSQTSAASKIISQGGANPAAKNPYNQTIGSSGGGMTSIYPGAINPASGPTVALPRTISSGKQDFSFGGGSSSGNAGATASFEDIAPQTRTLTSSSFGGSDGTGVSSFSSGGGVGNSVVVPGSPGSVSPKIDNTGLAGGLAGYYQVKQDGTLEEAKQQQESTEDKVRERADLYDKYLGVKPSVFEDPEVKQARENRMRIQESLKAPTAELNAIIAKQNQDILGLRQVGAKEGVTEAVFSQQENAVNYNAAIRALPLQASIASLQGDLKLAQDYLTELTQIKSEQINRQYEYNKALFSSITGVIDKEDERAYNKITKANDRAYEMEKELIKTQASLTQQALANGAPTNVISRINNSRTIQDSIIAAGEYGIDKLDRDYKQAQVDKMRAEVSTSQPATGNYASIINGASALVPATKKKEVKSNITNALANNNYEVAYAEIANAVADGLTGTNKTKFDDARTDIGVMMGMKNAIQAYSNAGGDMGLLKGTEEKIRKNLGIDSGKASVLGTQLWREFQAYRSNMTGAAFSPSESRDYASVNPTLGKSLDLNLSVIDGAVNQLTNRITSTVNGRIPEAQEIFDLAYRTNTSSTPKDGETKEWKGTTYKLIKGVWTPQ